jgi:hypothetical protein
MQMSGTTTVTADSAPVETDAEAADSEDEE